MVRVALPLLALILAGCVPADPLDWRVDARTPNDYNAWREADLARVPPELRREFDHAFNTLAALTPGVRTENLDSSRNELCRRLHGRTIRTVLIEAYGLESIALLSRIQNTHDNMLRNVQLSARAQTQSQANAFERTKKTQLEAIATMEAEVARVKQRVAQLTAAKS